MFHKQHFDHRFDILELFLTVRDPGTSKAAEAYEGLRKSVINANKGTQVHLAHLAELHRVASAADSIEPVLTKVGEFMNQVGLVKVDDPSQREFFEFTGGNGPVPVVNSPAYVSLNESGDVTGVVIRGVAHFERDLITENGMPDQADTTVAGSGSDVPGRTADQTDDHVPGSEEVGEAS